MGDNSKEDINKVEDENLTEVVPIVSPSAPRPWIRFWARSIDMHSFFFVVGVVWAFIDTESLDKINNIVLSMLVTFIWMLFEGACLSIFGTTLGKKLLKITVLNSNGQKLTTTQAFQRCRLVWWRGTGLGIGLPNLIACILGYSRLVREGITTWDRDMGNIILHGKIGWLRALVIGIFMGFLFALSIYGYLG